MLKTNKAFQASISRWVLELVCSDFGVMVQELRPAADALDEVGPGIEPPWGLGLRV